jgi:hypothetical protein
VDHDGRQRCRRAALAIPQAAWHSGEEPPEEARAVEERWGDTWAREEQEVDGGVLRRRQRSQKIRAEEQGFREEEERRKGPRTDLQNKKNTGTSL